MNFLRNSIYSKFIGLVAGITFLNMSIVLAELSALGITKKNSTLIQNLINCGFEEEKEGGESETDSSEKEIIVTLEENLNHHNIEYLIGQQRDRNLQNAVPEAGHCKIFSPPPEVMI